VAAGHCHSWWRWCSKEVHDQPHSFLLRFIWVYMFNNRGQKELSTNKCNHLQVQPGDGLILCEWLTTLNSYHVLVSVSHVQLWKLERVLSNKQAGFAPGLLWTMRGAYCINSRCCQEQISKWLRSEQKFRDCQSWQEVLCFLTMRKKQRYFVLVPYNEKKQSVAFRLLLRTELGATLHFQDFCW